MVDNDVIDPVGVPGDRARKVTNRAAKTAGEYCLENDSEHLIELKVHQGLLLERAGFTVPQLISIKPRKLWRPSLWCGLWDFGREATGIHNESSNAYVVCEFVLADLQIYRDDGERTSSV